ncbi:hypothetical protein GQ457_03G040290 [Hibiscus cannabinus]
MNYMVSSLVFFLEKPLNLWQLLFLESYALCWQLCFLIFGIRASLQTQGIYREAIKYHSLVLAIFDLEIQKLMEGLPIATPSSETSRKQGNSMTNILLVGNRLVKVKLQIPPLNVFLNSCRDCRQLKVISSFSPTL